MVTISVQLPVDVSFYFFPSVGFPVTFLQYGKKVSAEGLLHGGQKAYWGLGSCTRSGRVSQWPAGPKWAARRKVYVTLKMYLSTGKCRHPGTAFLRHFVDIIRVGYGYGSYWGAVFNIFFAIWSQYAFIRPQKKACVWWLNEYYTLRNTISGIEGSKEPYNTHPRNIRK